MISHNIFTETHNRKKLSAFILTVCTALSLMACGSSGKYEPLDQDDDSFYNIAVLQQADADNSTLEEGFIDALQDTIGSDHFKMTVYASGTKTKELKDSSLILTEGRKSLKKVSKRIKDIPVIGTQVVDFQSVLKTAYKDEEENTTGTNVTGISALPPIADQLSVLIEATDNLKQVGILYSPDDDDAIYQDKILEGYLTEAGIDWKEYIIPTDEYRAKLKKKGSSTHYKSTARLIRQAAEECSAFYISQGSELDDKAKLICKTAARHHVTTFGGDMTSGRYSLVTLYLDPYQTGYQAGEYAYRILVNGSDPGDMTIDTVDSSSETKLYTKKQAEKFDITFPKSFTEYSEFLKTYVPGTNTQRVGNGTNTSTDTE